MPLLGDVPEGEPNMSFFVCLESFFLTLEFLSIDLHATYNTEVTHLNVFFTS